MKNKSVRLGKFYKNLFQLQDQIDNIKESIESILNESNDKSQHMIDQHMTAETAANLLIIDPDFFTTKGTK